MTAQKLSISLPPSQVQFIENYKISKGCKSRSQVIEKALALLQEKELEAAYKQASQEIDEVWEITVTDGLSNETW
ncbi:CopG family transcriptional regulator [Crocosphaera sp. UHCC 0190]|uniref:ribbon-helix-helix domain-containing protein n=1 Tax=Crocosphaera sp. UHCC 0190 TaxID=3110246 RepID=UPI002B207D49|nr:CopG family transcriptional regulator [Crocosphaera sp. UHCC 0190]MEA5510273.1 CopG family transcriptional regulator [Crocosphaera sp. UHCC 0190]